jgi:hypothetical protein
VRRISTRLRLQLGELFGPELAAHPNYPQVAMLTVEIARGLAFSAPIRRGSDATLLDFWCSAAAVMLMEPAIGAAAGSAKLRNLLV